jgi:hypothetical protein
MLALSASSVTRNSMTTKKCPECHHMHTGVYCMQHEKRQDIHGDYEVRCHCRAPDSPRPRGCHCAEPCRNDREHDRTMSHRAPYFCASCYQTFNNHTVDGKCLFAPGMLILLEGCRHCRDHNGVSANDYAKLGAAPGWGCYCNCPLGLRVMKYHKERR